MTKRYTLKCLGQDVTMLVDEDGVAFDGWDERIEQSWMAIGGADQPSPCVIVAQAIRDDALDETLVRQTEYGDIAVLDALLLAGADVDGQDESGNSALHMAIFWKQPAVIDFLFQEGADITARNNHKDTPLHYAAYGNRWNVIKTLVDMGADANARNSRGQTPLYPAVFDNHPQIVALLIDRGADINNRDEDGNTPLHEAALGGNLDAFRVLVAAGADLDVKNNDGLDVVEMGIYEGQDEGAGYVMLDYIDKLRDGRITRADVAAPVKKYIAKVRRKKKGPSYIWRKRK